MSRVALAGKRGKRQRMPKTIPTSTAADVRQALRAVANPAKAEVMKSFFKTGPEDYSDGDRFLGVVVPEQRRIAKRFADLALHETKSLLCTRVHEERLTALLILVRQYQAGDLKQKQRVATAYLQYTAHIDAWDLVDLSAPSILGAWLLDKDRYILFTLAKSPQYWERRIAIIATYAFIRAGDASDTLALAAMLLHDKHDLIHKAVGWMLREVGKRIGKAPLLVFLRKHASHMPRTALRYAIEHFPEAERQEWLRMSK
jgi:3-methyladenine DNA glycosylase AlkD